MDQLRSIAVVAALCMIAGAATACTPTEPATLTSPTPSDTATLLSPEPTQTPSELEARYVQSEPLLGKLDSIRGTAEIGPLSSSTGRIFIYIRCLGESDLHVEIAGAASFDQKCLTDPGDPGTLNSIDVSYVDEITVHGSADNANLWALAVTEAPAA